MSPPSSSELDSSRRRFDPLLLGSFVGFVGLAEVGVLRGGFGVGCDGVFSLPPCSFEDRPFDAVLTVFEGVAFLFAGVSVNLRWGGCELEDLEAGLEGVGVLCEVSFIEVARLLTTDRGAVEVALDPVVAALELLGRLESSLCPRFRDALVFLANPEATDLADMTLSAVDSNIISWSREVGREDVVARRLTSETLLGP